MLLAGKMVGQQPEDPGGAIAGGLPSGQEYNSGAASLRGRAWPRPWAPGRAGLCGSARVAVLGYGPVNPIAVNFLMSSRRDIGISFSRQRQ
jgi:hypothetical protein